MKLLKSLVVASVLMLSASMFTGCMMMGPTRTVTTVSYENPQWAPPYYSGARYYYLPDLELYYDLSTREYIFLMDGRWNFSPYLPTMYQNYNLNNCFCIVMNVDVYRPWLHHQYYVSHYPRYYYRDYYDRSNIPYVRAYNENLRRAVYWNDNERSRARPWNDENLRDNRRFKYSDEDKREQRNQTQLNQQQKTFGGESRGGQQNNANQTRTTTRTETTTQPRNNTTQPRTSTQTETNTQTRPETRTRTENGQTETRTRIEATPQSRTSTQTETETRTRTEATPQSRTSTQTEARTPTTTRTTTTTTRQASTNNDTPPVRNNQTNYYGKTIGNSVRVTKEMKDNTPTPASRNARQNDPLR